MMIDAQPSRVSDDDKKRILWEALEAVQNQLELSDKDLKAILGTTSLSHWRNNREIPIADTACLRNLRHFLAIHRSLSSIFSNPKNRIEWLQTKHPFLNSTPLEMMLSDVAGLIDVRRYLDYVRSRGA